MRLRLFAFACVLVLPFLTHAQGSAEQQLLQLEKDWCTASLKKDAALLGRILADDYSGVTSRGFAETKTQALDSLKDKNSTVTTCVDDDMKVRVYGDTAVVTGLATRAGTYQGTPFSNRRSLWTDVFVRRGGQWQVVASQSTLVPSPQK